MWPEGCGQVHFSCPVVRKMKPLLMVEEGKVRRVRGIAYPSVKSDKCRGNLMQGSQKELSLISA